MLKYFEVKPGTPADIISFERRMMASLIVGLLVGVLMSPELVDQFGPWLGIAIIFVCLGGAFVVTLFVSRRRSNFARWLFVIGSVIAIVPWLSYLGSMLDQPGAMHISILQLILQLMALYKLFQPHARAWFAGVKYQHLDADGVPDDIDE